MGADRGRAFYERENYIGIFKPSRSIHDAHECQIIRLTDERDNMIVVTSIFSSDALSLGIDTVNRINLLIYEDNR